MSISFDAVRLRRTAIWGYGREGQAALNALRLRFPEKKLTLLVKPEEAAQWDFSGDPNLEVITDEATPGLLGQFATIIKSPGISPYAPALEWVRFRGTRFISGSALWFSEHSQDRTICITGTKGKSTVSALTAHLLRCGGHRTALCGNIGLPLLDLLEPETPPEWWVIELSSYQTVDAMCVPAIAVVLNLFPEHLPWHGSLDQYYADKLQILADGKAEVAVLNGADARLVELTKFVERGYWFNVADAWHVREGHIYFAEEPVLDLKDLRLSGRHNAENVCAALTIVHACGLDARALARHVCSFHPLPHRLQHLGARGGLEYVDDSIATTPHASVAALESLSERAVTILLGGFERGLPWDSFVDYVQQNPPHAVICFGDSGPRIAEALRARLRVAAPELEHLRTPGLLRLAEIADLPGAIALAVHITPRGGTVLLSPGAPSFDSYASYAERGRAFAELAGFGDLSSDQIPGLGIA